MLWDIILSLVSHMEETLEYYLFTSVSYDRDAWIVSPLYQDKSFRELSLDVCPMVDRLCYYPDISEVYGG